MPAGLKLRLKQKLTLNEVLKLSRKVGVWNHTGLSEYDGKVSDRIYIAVWRDGRGGYGISCYSKAWNASCDLACYSGLKGRKAAEAHRRAEMSYVERAGQMREYWERQSKNLELVVLEEARRLLK